MLPPDADVLPPLPVEVPVVPGAQPSRAVVVTMQAHSVSTDPIERMPLTAGDNPTVLKILGQFSTPTEIATCPIDSQSAPIDPPKVPPRLSAVACADR